MKAGDLFVDFRGHWIPQGVKSPVEEGRIKLWPPTRLLLATEGDGSQKNKKNKKTEGPKATTQLDFVSSVPQVFDFVERTIVLQDANVCMFPYEDEDGHIVFKSQFIKDIKKGKDIVWWVPSIQAQGRAVNMPMNMDTIKDKERQRFLLETSFRKQHGESIQKMHQSALDRMEQLGYVEHHFADKTLQQHLWTIYRGMQQYPLEPTTIRMKRIPYFDWSSEDHAKRSSLQSAWIPSCEAVFRAMSEWGQTVLGSDYALVRDGPYGPHCLLSSTTMPQRLHLDSVYPFFSGLSGSDSRFSYNCMLVIMY